MLPVFPNALKAMDKAFREEVERASHGKYPWMAKIPRFQQTEGDKANLQHPGGKIVEMDYRKVSFMRTFSYEEAFGMSPEEFLEMAASMGEEMANARFDRFLAVINESTEESGNIVRSSSGLSFEALVQTLTMLEADFDQAGMPEEKFLLLSPEMAEQLRQSEKEWMSDPAKLEILTSIQNQKKREYYEREARRTMVD
jgi:hypothetical protein